MKSAKVAKILDRACYPEEFRRRDLLVLESSLALTYSRREVFPLIEPEPSSTYPLKKWLFLIILGCLLSPLARSLSLFNESTYQPLIADRRAYLPGDLLTVMIIEAADAQSSADLASHKEIKTAAEASYNSTIHQDLSLELNSKGQSAAKTGRNGKIKAALTVRIKQIQPGGSYLVAGQQRIRINGELQTISLSGILRSEDISPQNTVLSTRLANAAITYTGNGSVSNAQRHNYLYQVLSLIGLV